MLSSVSKYDTYRVTYDIDLTGYNGPSGATYVSSLAAKVVSGSGLSSWKTVSGSKPTSGTWTDTVGGLSSNGCNGNGGGWVCIQWKSGTQLTVGGVYSWVFDVTVKKGTLLDIGSVKANFDPKKGVLLSENVSLAQVRVPEGGAAEIPLLISGLGLILFWKRNRFRGQPSASR